MLGVRDRVIVALDLATASEAVALASRLQGRAVWMKVGMTLFYAEGPGVVRSILGLGQRVFVDLKLHDIPHQVEGAARSVARLGAGMMTVHAAGGRAMMEAAVRGAAAGAAEVGAERPAVLAVTVLTSMDHTALSEIGVDRDPASQVEVLARLALDSGVDGVVCSPREAAAMRAILGDRLVVTPGVRPAGAATQDQSRVASPVDAFRAGSTHVVVGRPITEASDPIDAFESLVTDTEEQLWQH